MQEVRTGSDRFLLKALGEAAGELRNLLYSANSGRLLEPGRGSDEAWCLLAIAVHLRNVEWATGQQIETIVQRPGARIRSVDLDDIPFEDDYAAVEIDEALGSFHHARRQTTYSLSGLMPEKWQRSGVHPYRGEIAVIDLARDLYKHDLEHLWQVRRMLGLEAPTQR